MTGLIQLLNRCNFEVSSNPVDIAELLELSEEKGVISSEVHQDIKERINILFKKEPLTKV